MVNAIIVAAVSHPSQAKSDKVSLAQQEKDARALCEAKDWDVLEVIRIPGFSRSFYTLRELADHASDKGVDGPGKLERHIHDKDFDVLVVRSTNRFGREQSLNAEVIGRVVKQCGATIYSLMDGAITRDNYRGVAAITGFRDSSEIDELVKKRQFGIVALAQRGIPINARPPMSHRLVRDAATGKQKCLELREEYFPLWHDLATLLLEGVAYDRLEDALFTRYGYTDRSGRVYRPNTFYRLFLNPAFWGNAAIRWKGKSKPDSYGLWAFDRGVLPPEGVDVFYDTGVPPVYTGETAARVQAEIRRRTEVYSGRQQNNTHRFTGLVLCDLCGNACVYHTHVYKPTGKINIYLRCNTQRRVGLRYDRCDAGTYIREDTVLTWFQDALRRFVESGHVVFTDPPKTRDDSAAAKVTRDRLQTRLDGLISELSLADDDLKEDYRKQIRAVKDDLLHSERHLATLETGQRQQLSQQDESRRALDALHAFTLEGFWLQDDLTINQLLRRLLGSHRLVMRDGAITHVINPRQL